MDMGNLFAGGDSPESDDLGEEGQHRGWISPDDRLWRHPSEVANLGRPSHLPPLQSSGARARRRRPVLTAGVVGAAAVAATMAIALTVVDSPAGPDAASTPFATDTSMVTVDPSSAVRIPAVPTSQGIMSMVSALKPSLVELSSPSDTSTTTKLVSGVVMPGGHLVVTAAAAVTGMSVIDVFTSDGKRHQGTVVGMDQRAGVAVVKVDDGTLIPATFADENVEPYELAVTECMCDTASSSAAAPTDTSAAKGPHLEVAVGMVRKTGMTVNLQNGPDLIDVIEAEMPLGSRAWGGVLLDGNGQVVGVLDGEQIVGSDTIGLFVPTNLALGVADELAHGSPVTHGWLGVVGTDDPGDGGALLTSVLPNGPAAAAGLAVGDVVNAVDAHRVVSLADLQARLYTDTPGTAVELSVTRPSGDLTVAATLASTPSN